MKLLAIWFRWMAILVLVVMRHVLIASKDSSASIAVALLALAAAIAWQGANSIE